MRWNTKVSGFCHQQVWEQTCEWSFSINRSGNRHVGDLWPSTGLGIMLRCLTMRLNTKVNVLLSTDLGMNIYIYI